MLTRTVLDTPFGIRYQYFAGHEPIWTEYEAVFRGAPPRRASHFARTLAFSFSETSLTCLNCLCFGLLMFACSGT